MPSSLDEIWGKPHACHNRRIDRVLNLGQQSYPIVLLVVDAHAHEFFDVRDLPLGRSIGVLVSCR